MPALWDGPSVGGQPWLAGPTHLGGGLDGELASAAPLPTLHPVECVIGGELPTRAALEVAKRGRLVEIDPLIERHLHGRLVVAAPEAPLRGVA